MNKIFAISNEKYLKYVKYFSLMENDKLLQIANIKVENYLKDKYSQYPNIKFVGSIPHKDLSSFIEQFGFHINNTALGSYDKSVLETMAAGIINFYTNSDYDKNIPSKYEKVLKYNGTIDDLTKKIHSVDELKNKELHEIITFSQNSVKNESLETIHERISKII